MEEGFQWFGTDEGVLGRTLNVGFFRDTTASRDARSFVQTVRVQIGAMASRIVPRHHSRSDRFFTAVWTRTPLRRFARPIAGISAIVSTARPADVCIFWTARTPGNITTETAANFLSSVLQTHHRRSGFRALTASEAIAATKNIPTTGGISRVVSTQISTSLGHARRRCGLGAALGCAPGLTRRVEARAQSRGDAPTEER